MIVEIKTCSGDNSSSYKIYESRDSIGKYIVGHWRGFTVIICRQSRAEVSSGRYFNESGHCSNATHISPGLYLALDPYLHLLAVQPIIRELSLCKSDT